MTPEALESAIEYLANSYFYTTFKKGGSFYKRKLSMLGYRFAMEFDYRPDCCERMSVRPAAVLLLMVIKKKLLEGAPVFDGKTELAKRINRSGIIISDIYIWLKIKKFITIERLLPVNKYRKMSGIVNITPYGERLIECSLRVCDNLRRREEAD